MTMRNTIFNEGLALTLESLGRPIHKKLAKRYPKLSAEELENYATTCDEVIRSGYKLADEALAEVWKAKGWKRLEDLDTKIVYATFRRNIKQQYPWLDKDTMSRIFSQGIYAALK